MLAALDLLLLTGICFLGAATPGISLAVITRHTVIGGSGVGVVASACHALGVGLWALATVTGLALLFQRYPHLNQAFHVIGGLFLLWMAWRSWQASQQPLSAAANDAESLHGKALQGDVLHSGVGKKAFIGAGFDGFMIAFLNPKVGLFYLAIFSQFLNESLTLMGKAQMVLIAGLVDGL
jgi:threonine/homoserine/homoserine lactone efflux protein